jgi:Alpha galactosidase C-terminal beta sandwich domain/Flagellar motor switch protein FliM
MSAEQIPVVNTLHENFARRLSDSLGTYLRSGYEIDLVAALEHSEYLGRVPELQTVKINFREFGFKGNVEARDTWAAKDLGTLPSSFKAHVPAHGVVLLLVCE